MKKHLTRRILALVLTLAMVLSLLPNVFAAELPFTDVKEGSWYAKSVAYVLEKGLMKGTTDTTFGPDETMNRAMLVTVLYRAENSPKAKAPTQFTDVPAKSYYTKAVGWAVEKNITKGTTDTTFSPFDNLSREMLATFLYRYAEAMGYDTAARASLDKFSDKDTASKYARTPLQWAVAQGILKGDDKGLLRPKDPATRAEAATMLMRALESLKPAQEPKELEGKTVILHTNDVHGAIMGYAQVAAVKAEYEAKGAKVLLVDAGDYSQGTIYVSTNKGAAAVEMMNAAGYDLATLGNHEFDFGYAQLVENMKNAEFQPIVADVLLKETGKSSFDGHVIKEIDGVKIGFFGMETPETFTKVNPGLIQEITFPQGEAMYACAQAEVDALKAEGADLIIGLVHLGVDLESEPNRSVDLFKHVEGIDFLIDGHSHTVMTEGPNGEPIQSTGTKASDTSLANVGYIEIDNASKAIVDHKLIPITEDSPKDEAVAAKAQEIMDRIDAEYNEVFARTEVRLNGDRAPGNRTEETNLGDLITDAMRWAVLKEGDLKVPVENVVAITNGGGIRATIEVGDITKAMVNSVLPFGNTVAVVYVTGAELLEALEASTHCTPTPLGGFPQTAGMKVNVDLSKPFLQGEQYPASIYYGPASINRVTIDEIGGKPFDPEATYAVVTNNFCAAGGDTYYAFQAASEQFDTSLPMDEVLMDYIETALDKVVGQDYAEPQGRMTFEERGTQQFEFLITSDIHGQFFATDYTKPYEQSGTHNQGMTRVSTYLKEQKAEFGDNAYIVDMGDTFQGAPLTYYYAFNKPDVEDPAIKTFRHIGYDMWIVGNHEFNYGLDILTRQMDYAVSPSTDSEKQLTISMANYLKAETNNDETKDWATWRDVTPYVIKDFGGVKVAIIGFGNPNIPKWDVPANWEGIYFANIIDTYKHYEPEMLEKADMIVVVAHSGISSDQDSDFMERLIKATDSIAFAFSGHEHGTKVYEATNAKGEKVPILQPGTKARYVAKVLVNYNKADDSYEIAPELVDLRNYALDQELVDILQPYETDTWENYMLQPIGKALGDYPAADLGTAPSAFVDLINTVQLWGAYDRGGVNTPDDPSDDTPAMLSITAPLTSGNNANLISEGDIYLGDMFGLYRFENWFYQITMSGEEVHQWLEYSASKIQKRDNGYNIQGGLTYYDIIYGEGFHYDIDVSKPAGERVVHMTYKGQPVTPDQEFTVVVNNYRYNGGGDYVKYLNEHGCSFTPNDPDRIIYSTQFDMIQGEDEGQARTLLTRYIQQETEAKGGITPSILSDWRILDGTEEEEPVSIRVFETTDIHGYLLDASTGDESTFQYRMAYLAKIFNDARASEDYDDVLLLDGGDIYQGTPVSNLLQGRAIRAALDKMGYDAVALGNHEFDWGVTNNADQQGTIPAYEIGSYSGDPDIPVVAYNLYYADSNEPVSFTKDYVMVEKAGYRIAIVGYIPNYRGDIMAAEINPYVIDQDLTKLAAKVQEVNEAEAPDITIVLAHESPKGIANAMDPAQVDLVLGGHSHSGNAGVAANGIPYLQGNCQAKGYAAATIKVTGAPGTEPTVEVEAPEYVNTTAKSNLPNMYDTAENADKLDPVILELSHLAWDDVKDDMEEVLGYIDTSVTKSGKLSDNGATTAGNWISGLMLRGTADLAPVAAFYNSGGIRTSFNIPEGETTRNITTADIYTINPFDNCWLVFELTGPELAQQLLDGFREPNYGDQMSGLSFTYWQEGSGKTAQRGIVSITLSDGTEIDLEDNETTYRVCTTNYSSTLDGSVFLGKEPLAPPADAPIDNVTIIRLLREEGLANNGYLSVDTTGRGTRVEKPASVETTFPSATKADIDKYGDVHFSISSADLAAAGFEYADLVKLSFLDQELIVPVIPQYRYVGAKAVGLVMWEDGTKPAEVEVFNGSFAATYGLADVVRDGSEYTVTPKEGVEFPVPVTITMYEKQGYADTYVIFDLTRSNNREDYRGSTEPYPNLTDEEFANFRKVSTTGMGEGTLYRSSSPINPAIGRNGYADAAAEAAGVKSFVNLADSASAAAKYDGYAESYYSDQNICFLNLGVDFSTELNREGLKNAMEFIAGAEAPVLVHCNEGQDRAGFVSALLECLMGATYEEVVEDYMVTFYNYYGVQKGTDQYNQISNNIVKNLSTAFGLEMTELASADLAAEAQEYFLELGVSEETIAAAKETLGGAGSTEDKICFPSTENADIAKYGNIYTNLDGADFFDLGFTWGDIVTVKFLNQELELPIVPTFSYVDQGSAGVFVNKDGETGEPTGRMFMAINMGNFAEAYGLAVKTTNPDKSYFWTAVEGVEFPVPVTVEMKEAGGYLSEMLELNRTNNREDYPDLSDAEYANFRRITTTGMGDHLYRGSSPINPELGRNTYADAQLEKAGVTVIMNLANSQADAEAYEGYTDSYYSKQNIIFLNLDVDFQAADFQSGLANGLRHFAQNEGTYYVHCTEGKDRAGFVSALLECFMGASYDEVVADYLKTYTNYFNVVDGVQQPLSQEDLDTIANSNIVKSLQTAFGVEDLKTADLAVEAQEYISQIGLSDAEIEALRANLGGSSPHRFQVDQTSSNSSRFGHVDIKISAAEFLELFDLGDVVTVTVNDFSFEAPVVTNYDDVDTGAYLLRCANGKKVVTLAINYGQIGVKAGLLEAVEGGYAFKDGLEWPMYATVTLKEAGGYADELSIRKLTRTNNRDDYADLSDAEFANFRAVTTTGMGENVLYRSSSPIDPDLGRNSYADAAAQAAGIKTFINLADTQAEAEAFAGYTDSYYSTQSVKFLGLPVAFTSDEFKAGLAEGYRFINNNQPPYLIHCLEGKDRTGLSVAVLECLLGASLEEVQADYLKTYENYFEVKDGAHVALTADQEEYLKGIITRNLAIIFDVTDMSAVELSSEAWDYLLEIGLDEEEIDTLTDRLR